MIQAIPKVKLTDKATWVPSALIAISADDLKKYGKRFMSQEYFQKRTAIVLSIIPDDFEFGYVELLEQFLAKYQPTNLILTSVDCACYTDQPAWCEEELVYLHEDNTLLFQRYPIQIGILKGYDRATYERIRQALAPHVEAYLLYISGEARSHPRGFSLLKFIKTHFPEGLDKPVYLHGCPIKQMGDIPQLPLTVKGIITAGHIADAIYRGNPHYKRGTRIQKAWTKWSEQIHQI